MPWSKVDGSEVESCNASEIAVVKDSDGSVEGCHATESDADDQISALNAAEEGQAGSEGGIMVPRLDAFSLARHDYETGDKVEWDSSGDRPARGVIREVEADGTIEVPGADFSVEGTEDDPAALIEVMEPTPEGHTPTGDMAAHKFSTLRSTEFEVAQDMNEQSGAPRRPILLKSDTEPVVSDDVAQLRSEREGRLMFGHGAAGSAYEPTEAELAQINEISNVDLSADEVLVFEDYAASNNPMPRRPLRLTESALTRLADRYSKGRQFRAMHDESERVGATFDASVEEATVEGESGTWLKVKSYAVLNGDTTPERRQLIQDMQTGVLGYTSIHADGGDWETVELGDEAERPFRLEIHDNPEAESDRLEAKELSRVDLGAVEEAQAIK